MGQIFSLGRQVWQKSPFPVKVLGVMGAIALSIRVTPYFVPMRAADIAQTDQAFTFYDRHGLRLGTVLSENQEETSVVELDEISPYFKQAILSAEDKNFYGHGALDLKAIARAMLQAAKHRKIVSGASTVTMQLARMLEPNPWTIPAKLQEIWLSWRLAAGMTHDEILAAYINRLPMGGNIYGVEAAARIYFGVSAADLSVAQAAVLASLPNNPVYLNPYEYWENLKVRQKYVLDRMVVDGYISQVQADQAFAENLTLQPRHQGIEAAPHFLFWLTDQLDSADHPTVKTSLERELQKFVTGQVQQTVLNLGQRDVTQAAAIALDNETGEILAYVGSRDYFDQANGGQNDGVQALRQPGSTLKPFLYQLALEQRTMQANTVLADIPTYYAIPGEKLYEPTDYSETFLGPVRVRLALANSLNIPAVRVLEDVGVANFLTRLQDLGFGHLDQDPEYYGLGLTLGSGEVNLLELANAYRAIANQGNFGEITGVLEGERSPLAPLVEGGNESSSWQLITDMLSDKQARAIAFGVDSALNLPFPAAVKTGTSSNYRDTWTVGFTEKYTVAVWVGNFDGSPMNGVSGVMGAAPLWREIMLQLHKNQEPSAFPEPTDMVKKPICALSGKKSTGLCPAIAQEYFYPEDLAQYETDTDDFYQEINSEIQLTLPAEYNDWLATQTRIDVPQSGLQILFPNDGDRLLSFSGDTNELQIQYQTMNNQPVQWFLNNQPWQPTEPNHPKLEIKPGNWSLKVQQGNAEHQVNFVVEQGELTESKRGFSVN
ncbi:penicillin-binding protein 1C [[Limnothrix rosea] IAM M-220]|uniref:penicillin-binding protein 1C n=1 Tax=[Limnothrix rosea] IAM M-220 TaxID=454133 RepID=UPI000963106F|nr:penicillin-binding protein 1C [[Limnothrix rosea] IAM M-220]OKH14176.1 penicillin-binding protein 1C [[Limnothrix rosea] IAM M-220]